MSEKNLAQQDEKKLVPPAPEKKASAKKEAAPAPEKKEAQPGHVIVKSKVNMQKESFQFVAGEEIEISQECYDMILKDKRDLIEQEE